ncbi:ComEA family DNA-binding protein [Flavobacterium sp. N2270]|uniref:ComEA family DNA-binding protein n=1 Tax=Flavobacterium sp. N2270 TaxID=2986831 RepID=UPI0022259327|nr:helix-hairpin-helix domain-containing protein [Flavobacterium sp. N2270]
MFHNIKSHFLFSKEHRGGIFLLIVLIVLVQLMYFFIDFSKFETSSKEKNINKDWLLVQSEIDSLNAISKVKKFTILPFNPNFISDYKGYLLGMSVNEIDRLHKYRENNKFVNSAKEFQDVTKVSDSLLKIISPNFKFPDWVTKKNKYQNNSSHKFYNKTEKVITQKDINIATKEEIMEVYGIGDKISDIILQEKEKFGAFASIDQLEFVWGVSPEALVDIKKRFFVKPNIQIKKVNINNQSIKELAKFPYFKYTLAKEIVTYRSMNGDFKSIDDLTKIKGMPNEKLKIIALYLEF